MTAGWTRRLHAGAKVALATGFLAAAVLAPPPALVAVGGAAALLLLASRSRLAFKGALLALPVALVTAVILALTAPAGDAVRVAGVAFYSASFLSGVVAGARFAVSIATALWAAEATPPREALALLARWPRVAVPAAAVARLAPDLVRDARAVAEARRLRGLATGGAVGRAREVSALLPPLVVRAARRGVAAEDALRAAGYDARAPRTAYDGRPFAAADWAAVAAAVALAALAIASKL